MTARQAPAPPADDVIAHTDAVLVERARTSAETLEGLISAGMLEQAGHPNRLPELLFPDIDPEHVRQVWDEALRVGFNVGKAVGRNRWDPQALDRLRAALRDAGYAEMGRSVERAAYAAPSRRPHPADAETDTTRDRP